MAAIYLSNFRVSGLQYHVEWVRPQPFRPAGEIQTG